MIVVGIDCGLSGALTFMREDGTVESIHDMPVFELTRNRKKKKSLDAYRIAELLRDMNPSHAFVEQVWARPPAINKSSATPAEDQKKANGGGYASAILVGAYNRVCGVIAGRLIPMTEFSPQKWKKALTVSSDKDGARARASQLLPGAVCWWPNKGHHDRAESALIAFYGLTTLNHIGSGER